MAFSYKQYEESDAVKKIRQLAEQNSVYQESDAVKNARTAVENHNANKVADWTGGTYGASLQAAMDKINNREAFTYDLNGDALYKQYKNTYMNQGKLAMQDTMGQAASLTGGFGSSYGTTAGQQMYQKYLGQLNDKVPELYSLALDKYNADTSELYNKYNLTKSAYDTEYGEYRDKVSDWNTEASRLSSAYDNERSLDYSKFESNRDYYTGRYDTERNADQSLYDAAYNRAFSEYQQGVSEQQYAEQMAYQKAQDELAQQNYLAEVEYQKERDAVADAKWAKEYALSAAKAKNTTTTQTTTTTTNKTKTEDSGSKLMSESDWMKGRSSGKNSSVYQYNSYQEYANAESDKIVREDYPNVKTYDQAKEILKSNGYTGVDPRTENEWRSLVTNNPNSAEAKYSSYSNYLYGLLAYYLV